MLTSGFSLEWATILEVEAAIRSRFWLALMTKNLLKATIYDIEVADRYLNAIATGWTMGKAAQPPFGVDWNAQWELPIAQVRSALDIHI